MANRKCSICGKGNIIYKTHKQCLELKRWREEK